MTRLPSSSARRGNLRNLAGILLAIVLALLLGIINLRAWEIDFSVPQDLSGGDYQLGEILYKSIYENGLRGLWFLPSMGAPDVSSLVDTPFLDTGIALEALLLGRILPSPHNIPYALYLLTFPLAAFTMYLLLNRMTGRISLKVFLSTAFSVTPYHFYRSFGHLTLSNYYPVPVGVLLALIIYEDEFRYTLLPARWLRQKWKILMLIPACAVLGLGNIYYAFFGLLCMGMALIAKMLRQEKGKKLSCLYKEASLIYLVLIFVLINLFPKLLFTWRMGPNEIAGTRLPMSTEFYALKIIQLLLPCAFNRIPFLSGLYSHYTGNALNINENMSSSLGFLAVIGFAAVCVWVIYRIIVGHRSSNPLMEKMNFCAYLVLSLIIYTAAGGIGTIVSYWITPEIRCLCRASVVIACICLCVLALGVEKLAMMPRFQRKRGLYSAALVLLSAFVLYSEFPLRAAGWQIPLQNEDRIYREFFDQVQQETEEGDMIYELPFMSFPESTPVNDLLCYEMGYGYIYTTGLKWSFGGIIGRNGTAWELLVDQGMGEKFLSGIRSAGFRGLYIDTRGYEDHGKELIHYYSDELGLTPIVSENGYLYYYDLSGLPAA